MIETMLLLHTYRKNSRWQWQISYLESINIHSNHAPTILTSYHRPTHFFNFVPFLISKIQTPPAAAPRDNSFSTIRPWTDRISNSSSFPILMSLIILLRVINYLLLNWNVRQSVRRYSLYYFLFCPQFILKTVSILL